MRLTFSVGHFRLDVSLCEDDEIEDGERDVTVNAETQVAAPFGFDCAPDADD